MKKIIYLTIIALGSLPIVTFGAYNDVTLGTSAIIRAGGYNLTVSGSSATIESITVASGSFTAVLKGSSTIKVASSDKISLAPSSSTGEYTTSSTCDSTESTATFTNSGTAEVDITLSPNSTACTSTSSSSSSGGNGPIAGSSGGGGGGGGGSATTATTIANTTNVTTSASGSITGISTVTISSFYGIGIGSRKSAVITIQKILNSDLDTRIALSGPGSPGNETTYFGPATKKAIQKFQVKYNIVKSGQTGYGVFGPKTKAKLVEVAKLKGI